MIIDAHTHIFFPEVREDRSQFMDGEDAFQAIYRSEKSKMVSAEELVAMMDEQGVDKAITFGFPWRSPETASRANDYVIEAVTKYPNRLIGFACIHAGSPQGAEELDRCLRAGLKGVGELAFYQGEPDGSELVDIMTPIREVLERHEVPLLLHANETVGHVYPGKARMTLRALYELLRFLTPIPVILAHWGGGILFYELMKKEVPQTMSHVMYDTAASPYLYRPEVYQTAVRICGAERIVFGSDFPLLPPSRYFKEMAEAGLSREQIRLICGENLARFLGC